MTPKQKRFIECYEGNATQAAITAGYSERTARGIGQELLTKPDIQEAIASREEERKNALIASREKRQVFWSQIMNDPEEKTADRLRASELLGKSEGDFLERVAAQVEKLEPPIINVVFKDVDEIRREEGLEPFGDE